MRPRGVPAKSVSMVRTHQLPPSGPPESATALDALLAEEQRIAASFAEAEGEAEALLAAARQEVASKRRADELELQGVLDVAAREQRVVADAEEARDDAVHRQVCARFDEVQGARVDELAAMALQLVFGVPPGAS